MIRIARWTIAVVGLASLGIVAASASPVVPSIEITASLTGQCDNSGGALNPDLPIFINVSNGSSDTIAVSVQGVGTVFTLTELNLTALVGSGTFSYGPSVYSVSNGTPITAEVVTYFGPGATGPISFRSRIVFACDTGQIISLVSGAPSVAEIPTLGVDGFVSFAMALAAVAALWLRRRRSAS